MGPHTITKRKLVCPHCGAHKYCKQVLTDVYKRQVQGNVDIAAVPANLASVLYNKEGVDVSVLAVNTLGVLYIVENGDSVQSVADLKGKTIYASGKGATPEYALNYMLTANGIDPEKDVTIEYKSEHSECVAAVSYTHLVYSAGWSSGII